MKAVVIYDLLYGNTERSPGPLAMVCPAPLRHLAASRWPRSAMCSRTN